MSDSLVKLMRASITDPVTGEQLFDMARPDLRTVDVLSCLERLERLTAERDAANRALFQAQEAAKKLLSERDALLVRLERAQQGWAAD